MHNKTLEKLGLSTKEAIIYQSLLSLGPSPIRAIAEKSEINRGTAHECLKSLLLKGVVNYLPRGRRKLFAPRDPEVLLQLAEKKQSGKQNYPKSNCRDSQMPINLTSDYTTIICFPLLLFLNLKPLETGAVMPKNKTKW